MLEETSQDYSLWYPCGGNNLCFPVLRTIPLVLHNSILEEWAKIKESQRRSGQLQGPNIFRSRIEERVWSSTTPRLGS